MESASLSSRNLVVRAGNSAVKRLRVEGLRPELFDTLVGGSGGPKWLVLRHLDEVLIDRLILPRSNALDTLGSSIGSFRHACFAQDDPGAALARFTEGYVDQAYTGRPTMEEVSTQSDRILGHLLGESGSSEIVSNKKIRNHIIAARLRNDRGHDRGVVFRCQLGAAATLNLVSRRLLERSFSRVHFESGEASIEFRDFETLKTPLSQENLRHALLASGSIPLVMAGVRSIPGLYGTLFDGGIIDYHFDFTFRRRKGLVLFPHFFDHITPGWFDKPLRWRKPRAADFDDVIMLAPSDSFIASLPGGRVPNRNDFLELETKQRIRQWQTVMDRCRVLADDFNDLLEGDRMADACEPYRAARAGENI
jgi:hypothetical protein